MITSHSVSLSFQHSVVRNALFCLETAANQKENHVYTKALLAYAFALAGNRDQRKALLDSLEKEAVRKGECSWWDVAFTSLTPSLGVRLAFAGGTVAAGTDLCGQGRCRERKDLCKGITFLRGSSQGPLLLLCSEGAHQEAPGTIPLVLSPWGALLPSLLSPLLSPCQALLSKGLAKA